MVAALSGSALSKASPRAAGIGRSLVLPLAAVSAALGTVALAARSGSASLPLPFGPPGAGVTLALDPVGAGFLLLLDVPIAIAALVAEAGEAAALLLLLGAGTLVALAGDGFLLVAAAGALPLAAGARPGRAVLVALCVAIPLAALLPTAGLLHGDDFALIRSVPGRGGTPLVVGLALAACVCLVWPVRAPPPGRAALTLAVRGALPALGVFVAVRLVLDLGAASMSAWSGLAVLGVGLAASVASAAAALRAETLDAAIEAIDLAAIAAALGGVGLALGARFSELPLLASASLGGAMLLLASRSLARPCAALAAASIERQAGGRQLALLGGMVHAMPRGAIALLACLATLAPLPPLPACAGLWLLLQSLLGAERAGVAWLPAVCALALAALALSIGLTLAAASRVSILVLFGRPRTPRAAAAGEIAAADWARLVRLALPLGLLGLLPGPFLRLLAPMLRELAGADLGDRAGLFAIAAWPAGSVFSPVSTLVLLSIGPALAVVWMRRPSVRRAAVPGEAGEVADAASWEDGAAPPPDWLPFGDPLAQALGATLAAPLGAGPATVSRRASLRRVAAVRRALAPAVRVASRRLEGGLPLLLVALALAGLAVASASGPR